MENRFLETVLRHETQATALLAEVVQHDVWTFLQFLGVQADGDDVRVAVEEPVGKKSRLDLVLKDTWGNRVAIIEIKVEATEHGNQLERYEEIGADSGALLVLLDIETTNAHVRDGWGHKSLVEAFACFDESSNENARVLGTRIADVLSAWQQQQFGPLGKMSAAATKGALRRLGAELQGIGMDAIVTGTAVNNPSITVFSPIPGEEEAFYCVDVRAQSRDQSGAPWLLRLGIHVNRSGDLVVDRRRAHRLALDRVHEWTLDGLRRALEVNGVAEAECRVLDVEPLKARPTEASFNRWETLISEVQQGAMGRRHPIFHHDWGRRLAGQFKIDVSGLTGDGLKRAIQAGLDTLGVAP